jgi:hypothetical protein
MHADIQQCTMATPWLNKNGCMGGGGEAVGSVTYRQINTR